MIHTLTRPHARRLGAATRRWLAPLLLGAPLLACNALDRALGVDAPSRVLDATLQDPGTAALRVDGAIADFNCALGAYIVAGGLMSGELQDASSTAARWSYDRRVLNPSDALYSTASCVSIGTYTPISVARFAADEITRRLQEWTDAEVGVQRGKIRQTMLAQAAAYAGYSLLLLGEAFCTVAIDVSPELPRDSAFARAEQRFGIAITAAQAVIADAAVDTTNKKLAREALNMSYVGRARARLNLGKYALAEADAALVPAGFEKTAKTSNSIDNSRGQNRIFVQNTLGKVVTVAAPYRGLTFGGVADPRVKVVDTGTRGSDRQTPLWLQTKDTVMNDPITIASYDEAQLIIAEARARATDLPAAVSIIDALHTRAGIPTYSSVSNAETNPDSVMAQVVEERRRELFLEGQRLFDVTRFAVPLVPAPGVAYAKGGTYGDQRCMPLPDVERLNNPNIGG